MDIVLSIVGSAVLGLGIAMVYWGYRARSRAGRPQDAEKYIPDVRTLRWSDFTRLPTHVEPSKVAFGWRDLDDFRSLLITQRLGFFFCHSEAEASARTAAAAGGRLLENVRLTDGGQRLVTELARNTRAGVYGPLDLGALTVMAADLFRFVRRMWHDAPNAARTATFTDIRSRWSDEFLMNIGRERRALRALLIQKEDVEVSALLYHADVRACELLHEGAPDAYSALLSWLHEQFSMLEHMAWEHRQFRPAAPSTAQLGPSIDDEIPELPAGAKETLPEVPRIGSGPFSVTLGPPTSSPLGRRVDAGRPMEDRATVLEVPRVHHLGERAGRFQVLQGSVPPRVDDSDDGDDVA